MNTSNWAWWLEVKPTERTTFEVAWETFTYPEHIEDLKRLTRWQYLKKYWSGCNFTSFDGITQFHQWSPYIFELNAALEVNSDEGITSFWVGYNQYNSDIGKAAQALNEKLWDTFLVSWWVLKSITDDERVKHLSLMHLWQEIKKTWTCEGNLCRLYKNRALEVVAN